jgi:hypothetical protein
MKVSGRCYCGQISFEAEIEPDNVRVCHCTDCQTLSGSAFRTKTSTRSSSTTISSLRAPKRRRLARQQSTTSLACDRCPDTHMSGRRVVGRAQRVQLQHRGRLRSCNGLAIGTTILVG